jgi:hypothetical protein
MEMAIVMSAPMATAKRAIPTGLKCTIEIHCRSLLATAMMNPDDIQVSTERTNWALSRTCAKAELCSRKCDNKEADDQPPHY